MCWTVTSILSNRTADNDQNDGAADHIHNGDDVHIPTINGNTKCDVDNSNPVLNLIVGSNNRRIVTSNKRRRNIVNRRRTKSGSTARWQLPHDVALPHTVRPVRIVSFCEI